MQDVNNILQSVTLKEYIANAKQAAKAYNWEAAYEYWDYIRVNFPDEKDATYQTANALYQLHALDEAQQLVHDYLQIFPDHVQAQALLGDIALAQGNVRLAYQIWHMIQTQHPTQSIGYVKLAKLAETRNPAEALVLWKSIGSKFSDVRTTAFKALVDLYTQHNYWHLALETVSTYLRQHPNDPNSYLVALTLNFQYIKQNKIRHFEKPVHYLFAQCASARQKFPDYVLLKILEAKINLWFNNYSVAQEAFEQLIDEQPNMVALYTHYAKSLVILGQDSKALDILLSQLDNPAAIESLDYIHQLLPLLHVGGDYIWQNHLDTLFNLMSYPDSILLLVAHLELFSLFDDALQIINFALNYSDPEYRLLYLKAKERIQNARHVESIKPYGNIVLEPNTDYLSAYQHLDNDDQIAFDAHLQLIDNIKNQYASTYLATDTRAHEALSVANLIIDAIKSKKPFSFVRASGHFLPYTNEDTPYQHADQKAYETAKWNGNHFVDASRYEHALSNADTIGITQAYAEQYISLEDEVAHRRSQAVLSWLIQHALHDVTLTASQANHDLQIWGLHDYILSHVDSVSIVSHATVGDMLMQRFGIGVRMEYLIPRDYQAQTPLDVHPNAVVHYPDVFNLVISQLKVAYPGEVFLVNAGVLGVIYCDVIKQQGGIALDIGETLDLWTADPQPDTLIALDIMPFYRTPRTSIWWRYLNAANNIPFQNMLSNPPKSYWINLEHRIDRRISTANNLNKYNIPHQRINATTPDNLPEFQMRSNQLPLLDVEKACLASHLEALKAGIENGNQRFFVREDDVQELAPINYDEVIATAPPDWDILQLHTHGIEALQYNYLAYLAGKMWLPWDWKSPSTASYLTNIQSAKAIRQVMIDENDVVNLKSITPSLPVADRALYKDFQTYLMTYPMSTTDGNDSDILSVNSFRHVRASMLSRRFHIMTHADNPQLQFSLESTARDTSQQQIIIGLGASHIGFAALQQILNSQEHSFISSQMSNHPYRFPSWENDEARVFAIINYMLETRDCRYVGDMMASYLNYVETLIERYPNAKFVCLHSNPEDEVEALLHTDPHTNIFQDHSGQLYTHSFYDRSVGKFEQHVTKLEAIQSYVALYARESSRLANKYPSNVWRFDVANLNDHNQLNYLMNWLGYEQPTVSNILEDGLISINSLDIPNYEDIVLAQNTEAVATDGNDKDTNLYEIHIYKGNSKDREFVNFLASDDSSDDIALHMDFKRNQNRIILNNCVQSNWGKPKYIQYTYRKDGAIFLYYDRLFHCMYILGANRKHILTFDLHPDHQIKATQFHGHGLSFISPYKNTTVANLWRFSEQKSGFNALSPTMMQPSSTLKNGLSMVIRAKNEEATIEQCLKTILPHVDEVIFVDNGSTDQTRLIAERLQQDYFNLKVYSYPIQIPPIGREHAQAVLNHSTNTLGHYYNWCLSHTTLTNFAKWDADYISIEENFVEMITQFQLRTRGDNFTLWFSGLELYTDGTRYWVDTNSLHNEYRVFSRKHGAHWVNLPPWEEIEQSYLYRAHKLVYEKPVYIELFRLDEIEFKDRGLFEGNERDTERMQYIQQFKETGTVPKSFVEVSGIDDPKIKDIPLSEFEVSDMQRANQIFNGVSNITHKSSGERQSSPVASIFTAIMSCRPNRDKQQIQRETWVKDMQRAGFTYAFVEGEIGRPDCLIGDKLVLNCRDEYEFLSSKTLAIVKWVYYQTNFDYLLKIDDDVILNPYKLATFNYQDYDYIGGRLIHDIFDPLWHKNKTWNPQLSHMYSHIDEITPYYGGQFSYFLSRPAMKALIENSHDLTTQLYEDVGVARALKAGGVKPASKSKLWDSRNYEEWRVKARADVACISDIPIDEMKTVYEALSQSSEWSQAAQEFNQNYDVTFDWMNIPHVISQL
jgi:glycosyltransferase involved in cell wall biosynthesis/thioredoxin-like negative regulator of GroEL